MFRPNVISAIASRNIKTFFTNVTGYLFIVCFVVVSGIIAFGPKFFADNLATLDQLTIALDGSGIDLETVGTELNGSISADVSRGKSNTMPAAVLGPLRARFSVQTDQPDRLVISDTTATGNSKCHEGE